MGDNDKLEAIENINSLICPTNIYYALITCWHDAECYLIFSLKEFTGVQQTEWNKLDRPGTSPSAIHY